MTYYYEEDCPNCYPMSKVACQDLRFLTGLTPFTDYTVVITNHFGQKYTQLINTNAGGNIGQLDISLFPDGMFNAYAGFFTLTMKEAGGGGDDLDLLIDGVLYPCILFDIYEETATN